MNLKEKLAQTRKQDRERNARYQRTFKFPRGKTKFRLLPGKANAGDFFVDFGQHFIKDSKGKTRAVVGDREICFNDEDPIRAALREAMLDATVAGDSELEKAIKDMMAARRRLVNIVVTESSGEFEENKPVMADFSPTQFETIMSTIMEIIESDGEEAAFKQVFDEGLVFSLTKEGAGMDTKYTIIPTRSSHKVDQTVIETMTDLNDYVASQFSEVAAKKAINAIEELIGRQIGVPDSALTGPATSRPALADEAERPEATAPASGGSAALEEASASDEDEEPEYAPAAASSDDDSDVLAEIENL